MFKEMKGGGYMSMHAQMSVFSFSCSFFSCVGVCARVEIL